MEENSEEHTSATDEEDNELMYLLLDRLDMDEELDSEYLERLTKGPPNNKLTFSSMQGIV